MTRNGLVLTGGTLIDGTGADARDNDGIAISGSRIRATDGTTIAGADQLECDDLTILPGLIDAHTHFGLLEMEGQQSGATPAAVLAAQIFANCARALDAGFTTARDVAGVDGGLARAIDEGLVPGPRLLPSGPMICQSGGHADHAPSFIDHPHVHGGVPGLSQSPLVADGPDAVRKAARTAFRRGATQLKLCVSGGVVSFTDSIEDTQFTVEEMRAAVEEARARRTYVTAHSHASAGIRNGIAAGIECFEHGTFLDEDTVALMVDAGVALVPTLAVIYMASEDPASLGIPDDVVPRFEGVLESMERAVKLAFSAGVPIGSGSDLIGPVQRRFGLELLLKSRVLGPMEAIRSATSVNARIIRRADELGTVSEGKLADVIAVRGNPLSDPELFDDPTNVVLVIKDGVVVKDER